VKQLKHPATIIAAVALFAALSGGAGAAMTTLISGSQIVNGSIPEKKLAPSAIKALQVSGMAHTIADGTGGCAVNTSSSAATFCGTPDTIQFDKKTAVLVTGSLDLASNNGAAVHTTLGICYAPHGKQTLTVSSFVYPDFVAPASSYFAQAATGVVGGLSGAYDVGLCLKGESSNALNGDFTVSALFAETNKPVKQLGPPPGP
jgi:hypothetical protein